MSISMTWQYSISFLLMSISMAWQMYIFFSQFQWFGLMSISMTWQYSVSFLLMYPFQMLFGKALSCGQCFLTCVVLRETNSWLRFKYSYSVHLTPSCMWIYISLSQKSANNIFLKHTKYIQILVKPSLAALK